MSLFPVALFSGLAVPVSGWAPTTPPVSPDYPEFTIAGHDDMAGALRDLYWHHGNSLRPMATLWDEWLLTPTIWPSSLHEQSAKNWRKTLLERHIDPDGYVATHQHQSIAHQRGWPFPAWQQSPYNFGWHFSFEGTLGPPWRMDILTTPDVFATTGTTTRGVDKGGWQLTLSEPGASISPPLINHESNQAPFLQLRWQADELGTTATPFIEWTTVASPSFTRENRMYIQPPPPGKLDYTMVPMYRHPGWDKQKITALRLCFDNATTGIDVTLHSFFAQFDTRHNVNNPSYVVACIDYFYWTQDLNFLRENIERMRLAMRFMETEFGTDTNGIVTTMWVGHEGTTGLKDTEGKTELLGGRGVGNNYWDLVPFGQQDSYATIRHFAAAKKMATLEADIVKHAGWNIPPSPLMQLADHWARQAEMAKEAGNRLFWNKETGRFTVGIDEEGNQADYGFTFLNLEAIAYDFATPEHARSILDWLDGKRVVETDTAQTTDIYHWRFAPRATTRRNVEHYGWFWSDPASIPYGDQVQDGGAVMGFSYHDIIARLKVNGPDDAAKRLAEIASWYREVQEAGGYRLYYDGKTRPGTLQGGGTAGGLGLDQEFFESVMLPQVLMDGFLGMKPTADGFSLDPRLPSDWPSLAISKVTLKGIVFDVEATASSVTLTPREKLTAPGNGLVVEIGNTKTAWSGTEKLTLPIR